LFQGKDTLTSGITGESLQAYIYQVLNFSFIVFIITCTVFFAHLADFPWSFLGSGLLSEAEAHGAGQDAR
jgi:hypothetical protein